MQFFLKELLSVEVDSTEEKCECFISKRLYSPIAGNTNDYLFAGASF